MTIEEKGGIQTETLPKANRFRIDTYHAIHDPHDSLIRLASGENGLLSIGIVHLEDGIAIVHTNTESQENEAPWVVVSYSGDFAGPEIFLHTERLIKESGVAEGLHNVIISEGEHGSSLSTEIVDLIEVELTLEQVLERISK